jgi:hypothetical protein
MEKLLKICDEKGLHKPKYYQGVYNAIARSMERKLLPLLRAHNVAFTGYVYVVIIYQTPQLLDLIVILGHSLQVSSLVNLSTTQQKGLASTKTLLLDNTLARA